MGYQPIWPLFAVIEIGSFLLSYYLALAWFGYAFIAACRGLLWKGERAASLFAWFAYAALWFFCMIFSPFLWR